MAAGTVQGKPPDGGYGWVILGASSFCMFLMVSIGRIGGMVFSAIIEEYHVTRTQASVIFVVSRVLAFGAAPVAGKLLEKYTYKTIFCISGFLMGTGFILTSLCTEIWQIVLTYGIILGLGSGCLISAAILIVGLYFKKKKSFAFGIYFAAGGCGGFIMPIIFGLLLEEYGYYGAMCIIGAILLHSCAVGMLIRQPSWVAKIPHDKKQQHEVPLMEDEDKTESVEEQIVAVVDNDQVLMRSTQSLRAQSRNDEGGTKKDGTKKNRLQEAFIQFFSGLKKDLELFKDASFISLMISRIGIAFPVFSFLSYFPDYVKHEFDEDMTDKDIAFVLAMSAIGDIIARFAVGTVLDKLPWNKKYTLSGIGILTAAFFFSFLFAQTYTSLFIFVIVFGLLTGNYVVCHMVLETELMGPKRLPIAHGLIQFFLGMLTLVGGITVGYIRDVTCSYEINFYIFGGCALCGGTVWYLEPLLRKCLPTSTTTDEGKEDNQCKSNGFKV